MFTRTLYGRLFALVPGHFSNTAKIRKNYYEKFKLGDNVGEFLHYITDRELLSVITIKNQSTNYFVYETLESKANGTKHELLLINDFCKSRDSIDIDLLSDELTELIKNKKDSDIISCSCCGWRKSN